MDRFKQKDYKFSQLSLLYNQLPSIHFMTGSLILMVRTLKKINRRIESSKEKCQGREVENALQSLRQLTTNLARLMKDDRQNSHKLVDFINFLK